MLWVNALIALAFCKWAFQKANTSKNEFPRSLCQLQLYICVSVIYIYQYIFIIFALYIHLNMWGGFFIFPSSPTHLIKIIIFF